MKAGVCLGAINPICGVGAWKYFGISAMLYGSEVWWNLTATEEELVNRVNVFAAKRLQGLCPTTHSIGALRSIGLWSIIGYIDKTKLLFLGCLCRTSPGYLQKRIFIKRLFSYLGGDRLWFSSWLCPGYYTNLTKI